MDDTGWSGNLRELVDVVERVEQIVHDLYRWASESEVASDALPGQIPEPVRMQFDTAFAATERARRLAMLLHDRLNIAPSERFLNGRRLTREQFYLIRAEGWEFDNRLALGLEGLDDYELFEHLCYEDGHRYCYINPAAEPREPHSNTIGLRFGTPPEELSRGALRPEQILFFQKHAPDVLARFGP
jgi:hypothetical protein